MKEKSDLYDLAIMVWLFANMIGLIVAANYVYAEFSGFAIVPLIMAFIVSLDVQVTAFAWFESRMEEYRERKIRDRQYFLESFTRFHARLHILSDNDRYAALVSDLAAEVGKVCEDLKTFENKLGDVCDELKRSQRKRLNCEIDEFAWLCEKACLELSELLVDAVGSAGGRELLEDFTVDLVAILTAVEKALANFDRIVESLSNKESGEKDE